MLFALPAHADGVRLAVLHSGLSRDGPGLLLRDIQRGTPDVQATAALIAQAKPDVLLLLRFDYDLEERALAAFQTLLAEAGVPFAHRFSTLPNSGLPSGLDLDGDGRITLDDAQGYGGFSGARGMAILSRLPIDHTALRDHSGFLWQDMPNPLIPQIDGRATPAPEVFAQQRLASTGYWEVPVILPSGTRLRLLVWHAGTPAFGRVPGRNARRNHDENLFWLQYLDEALPFRPPPMPFVLMGNSNLDPAAGGGMTDAMARLLAHPALQDPAPTGAQGPATSAWAEAGALRTSYILPARNITVTDHGIIWPPEGRHALVWMDLALP